MKHLPLLSSALLCALALAPNRSSAGVAYWKDWAYVNNGSTDHFLDLYTNWDDAVNADTDWTDTEVYFESSWPLYNIYTCHLSNNFAVKCISTNFGHNDIDATFDLAPYTLSTLDHDLGIFIKGQNNRLTLSSGILSVNGQVSIGRDCGSTNTFRVLSGATLHARALGLGDSSSWAGPSVENTLDVDGGLVLFDVEGGWGYAIGENPLDGDGAMLIHNGGIVSNFCNSALVGTKSCNNTLFVYDNGHYYNQIFQQLGQLNWDWNFRSTNNTIRAESGGVVELQSGLYIGSGSNPATPDNRNTLWAGDGGSIVCGGDVVVEGSGNVFVVSNGTFVCNSLHSITENSNDAFGTEFCFAGRSPSMSIWFYFTLRQQAKVHFDVPEGGYLTTPLTVRNGCKVYEDTTLTVDAKDFQHGGGGRLRLINADMDGYGYQKLYVPDDDESFTKLHALVARWNSTLPEGYSVELSADRCSLWLDVKPLSYTVVLFR